MKIGVVLLGLLALFVWSEVSAQVHVRGYYRRDGTYVAPHDRTYPNSTKVDNYSYIRPKSPLQLQYEAEKRYWEAQRLQSKNAILQQQIHARQSIAAGEFTAQDGVAALDALEERLLSSDPEYPLKRAELIKQARSVTENFPPLLWASMVESIYRGVRIQAGAKMPVNPVVAPTQLRKPATNGVLYSYVLNGMRHYSSQLPQGAQNTKVIRYSYVPPTRFRGYACTADCSGHEAGYEWAEDNGIDDVDDCDGNSQSFIEGCQAYVEENE